MTKMTPEELALDFINKAMSLRPESHLNLCQTKAQLQCELVAVIQEQRQQAVEEILKPVPGQVKLWKDTTPTLRDQFAMAALRLTGDVFGDVGTLTAAMWCYEVADAMLEARGGQADE